MLKKQVLLIGINPQFIDFSSLPSGINVEMIRQEAVLANEQLIAAGYDIYNCFIDSGVENSVKLGSPSLLVKRQEMF